MKQIKRRESREREKKRKRERDRGVEREREREREKETERERERERFSNHIIKPIFHFFYLTYKCFEHSRSHHVLLVRSCVGLLLLQ